MKYFKYLFTIYIIILLVSCAKQSTPMGGPKDEEPPELLSITPRNESLNIKPRTIELEFDEYVKVENPNKQIIITPRIKKEEMEVTAIKNKVILKLNQELEDSTTYVFNFQKTIKDITENNVPDNLKLVFSTGPTIDSLTFSGNVSYIFPQKEKLMKDVLVGLYALGDTTDILTAPPYYIGQADSVGNFNITNIKAGEFLAYAWHDSNNSLKAEEKLEAYGFLGDTINITTDISGVQFYISKSDISEFKINRRAAVGNNFDVVVSKFPVEINIEHEDINHKIFFRKNEKIIRFYHTELQNDSTAIQLNLVDSVGYKIDTLIYAKFEESDRAKEKLEPSIQGPKSFISELSLDIKFNKPLNEINYDSLIFKYDTASIIQIKKEYTYFKDSIDRTLLTIALPIPDSISNESFNFYASDSTFKDIEGVYNENKLEAAYKKLNAESLAEEVKVKVNTTELPIILQILNKKDEIIAEKYLIDSNETIFNNIEPGVYYIRAIIDNNNNKRWDTSNLMENRQAEPIYYLENPNDENSRDTTIRAGWILEVTIEPNKAVGLGNNSLQKDSNEKIIEEINVDN
ncbi:Ig-like domain-containing protein [Aquiflexum lacus]|uniref:Ig-like domain-containing protein n=1 Tax=Aquiflexum lacus TaxID=2483805 RepID=UPI0018949C71|nr:Ig-like domain-containing domain [Aquiflexum lacus]